MIRFYQPMDESDWEENPDWWKILYEVIVLFHKEVVELTLVAEAGQK